MPALSRALAVALLVPFVVGAHCKEDCGPPVVRFVGARSLERTLYVGGVLARRPVSAPLAGLLAPFERRELHLDVSRPAAVLLVAPEALGRLAHLDASRLKVGDQGPGFRVVGLVDQTGVVALFDGEGAVVEAARERYDAVMVLPRDGKQLPWEASVSLRLGRRVGQHNDEATGKCVDDSGSQPSLEDWVFSPISPACGDGVRQPEEDCDDGNHKSGDGCSPYCVRER